MKSIMPFLIMIIGFIACKKDNSSKNVTKTAKDSVTVYEGLTFSAINPNDQNQYFSTIDSSFKISLGKTALTATQLKNVDIIYIHDYNTDSPGFMDPVSASTNRIPTEADIYYYPALDSSISTAFYVTSMIKTDFDSVKLHPYLFSSYFQDAVVAQGSILFPVGSIIGDPYVNVNLSKEMVIGFMNVKSGKHGFIYVRPDQDSGWPQFAITGFRTKVDIIKEK
jgi:hypothetical protein